MSAITRFVKSPAFDLLAITVYAGTPWVVYSAGDHDAAILVAITMLGAFYIGRTA